MRRPRAALAALPTYPNPVEGSSDSWQAPPADAPDAAVRLEALAQPPDAPGYPNPVTSGHEALERRAGAAALDSAASASRSAAGSIGGAVRGSGSESGSGSAVRALVTWTGKGCAAALGLAAAGEAAGAGCWTTRCCLG